MNEVLNHLLKKKQSSIMLCEVKMLIKSVKRSFTEIELQAAHEKNLLKVNALKDKKDQAYNQNRHVLTSETANELHRSETKEIQ
jgi:hypothetical protein